MPAVKPAIPNFSSGPCAKRPGYSLEGLAGAPLGRSHRAKVGKAKLGAAIQQTRELLEPVGLPSDYLIGIVPASDTGAVEMAMWSMLGPKPVTIVHFESFGGDWHTDATKQLKLADVTNLQGDYGELPDLSTIKWDTDDVVFTVRRTREPRPWSCLAMCLMVARALRSLRTCADTLPCDARCRAPMAVQRNHRRRACATLVGATGRPCRPCHLRRDLRRLRNGQYAHAMASMTEEHLYAQPRPRAARHSMASVAVGWIRASLPHPCDLARIVESIPCRSTEWPMCTTPREDATPWMTAAARRASVLRSAVGELGRRDLLVAKVPRRRGRCVEREPLVSIRQSRLLCLTRALGALVGFRPWCSARHAHPVAACRRAPRVVLAALAAAEDLPHDEEGQAQRRHFHGCHHQHAVDACQRGLP